MKWSGWSWRRLVAVVVLGLACVLGTGSEAASSVAPEWPGWDVAPDAPATAPAAVASTGSVVPVPTQAPGRSWSWPLRPTPDVLARFDPPDVVWGSGHRGVDLSAGVGQEVLAPTEGVVAFSGVVFDRGVLAIETDAGLRTTFEPVVDALPTGTRVARGQVVAHLAATAGHCAPRSCLHWGVLRGDVYIDPLALVGATRVVLLPLRPP